MEKKETKKGKLLKPITCSIDENGCWICENRFKNKKGYVDIRVAGKTKKLHRYLYEKALDIIVPKGLCVCHTCDNPSCINLDHLWLGTNRENMDDMLRKGRSLKGEKQNNHKLTEAQILAIRDSNKTSSELADEYGVSRRNIDYILNKVTWKHI